MVMIFVNLPVANLERSKAFYTALGAEVVAEFTDENASCLKWDENVFFMVLAADYFATFTDQPVVMPGMGAQSITALSRDSREQVERARQTVLDNGGSENKPPVDHGVMYVVSMADPDGHIIEFTWMSDEAPQPAAPDGFNHQHPDANDAFTDAEAEGWPARE